MEQNILPFIPANCFSDVNIDCLNTHERKTLVGLAKVVLEKEFVPGILINNPEETMDFLQLKYMDYEHEVFSAMFLDQRHRLIKHEVLFNGTIDGAAIYVREVVKRALKLNAVAIIFAHNHPSGVCEPSSADAATTKCLKDALGLVDIRVLDHIVVGKEGVVSMVEKGLF